MQRSDDDCSGIGKQILLAWGEQKSQTQIAEEFKLELKFVMKILKREQKRIVEQGESSYGEESKS